jgi:hypothetical protein
LSDQSEGVSREGLSKSKFFGQKGDVRSVDPQRDWKTLVSFLPRNFEQLAVEHGLLNLQWPNAKVRSAEDLLRFILLHAGADLPLRQTVATIAESGGPELTAVALHQKMRRAQPYLASLVAEMTSDEEREAVPERWAGYEMLCLDATVVCGPGAVGTDARIHAVLRLHDLRVCDVHVTGAVEGETLRRFMWLPDQLVIVDRGYSTPSGVAHVVNEGADVLVRLNRGALPLLDSKDETLNPLAWSRTLTGQRVGERVARVVHRNGKSLQVVEGRLIAVRLPEKEAEEARERVRREYGRSTSAEQLEAAGYVMLFTTSPSNRLSASRCINAYRLRWQIELQFKRWKSLCHFDRLPNYRDDTIRSWLTAKVLLAMLLDRIASADVSGPRSSLARQPWKLTAIIWPLILSALLPLRLAHAADRMPAIADRLDALDGNDIHDRQIVLARKRFGQERGELPR